MRTTRKQYRGYGAWRLISAVLILSMVMYAACGEYEFEQPPGDRSASGNGYGKADFPGEKAPLKYAKYVEHRSAVTIGKNKYTYMKLNYGKDRFGQVVLNPSGYPLSVSAVQLQRSAQFLKYGKLHPMLYDLKKKNPYSYRKVLVWLDTPSVKMVQKPQYVVDLKSTIAGLAKQRGANLKIFKGAKSTAIKSLGLLSTELVKDIAETPMVVAHLSGARISKLAASKAVRMIMPYSEKGIEDINNSLAISRANNVIAAGTTGKGIRVAIWESQPTNTAGLNIQGFYTTSAGLGHSNSDHAEHVTGIVHSFAPDAQIYSADNTSIAALDWAIHTARVSAINQSFHRADEIDDGMSADDLYKDYKVLHYPWPFISHAAGNWCSPGSSCYEGGSDVTDEWVNHKGYNTISVGNHNDNATSMRASSCFINPSSPRGDRELPELAANGDQVTVRGMTKSGTSMSSPAVVGTAALVQQTSAVLKFWPEAVRALLLAGSTRNVPNHAGTASGGGPAASAPNGWWRDVQLGNDGFDGAGALNAQEAVQIAKNRWKGKLPQLRGWDIGRMTDKSFDKNGWFTKKYRITIPRWISKWPQKWPTFKKHAVKIALAWNSTATVSRAVPSNIYSSMLELDLDIRVYDSKGNRVAHSLSWDNSYEVVDFRARSGETYTIKIHRWPWSSKKGAWTWFGIAWRGF